MTTFWNNVGLPTGQMWNSEVWHMHIGAWRVIYQDLIKVSKAFETGDIFQNEVFQSIVEKYKKDKQPVHLIWVVSDWWVHGHIDHLIQMTQALKKSWVEKIFIHWITDGRDSDPNGWKNYVKYLMENIGADWKLVDIVGRYRAMDRDNRWERIQKAYDLLVKWIWQKVDIKNIQNFFSQKYKEKITDEFMVPVLLDENPETRIKNWDSVIFMNYRSDRAREISRALSQQNINWESVDWKYDMKKLDLNYVCLTPYDASFQDVSIMFDKDSLEDTLWEIISKNGLTQLRVAETEKYTHVTFFFSWGQETEFVGETRLLFPSPKVATYDLQPEMSAIEITDWVLNYLNNNHPDFIALNYANADMVGHTWVFEAEKKAVETLDWCLEKLVEKLKSLDYEILIIADHGNWDIMKNPDWSPHTQHTLSPVPVILVTNENIKLIPWDLTDIAPTILARMWIQKPKSMSWKNLAN